MTVHVVARIRARPDRIEEVRAMLAALVAPTRREPGCFSYQLLHSATDPADFAFVEHWVGDDAIDAHMQSAHVQEALARVGELLAAPPEIQRYHPAS